MQDSFSLIVILVIVVALGILYRKGHEQTTNIRLGSYVVGLFAFVIHRCLDVLGNYRAHNATNAPFFSPAQRANLLADAQTTIIIGIYTLGLYRFWRKNRRFIPPPTHRYTGDLQGLIIVIVAIAGNILSVSTAIIGPDIFMVDNLALWSAQRQGYPIIAYTLAFLPIIYLAYSCLSMIMMLTITRTKIGNGPSIDLSDPDLPPPEII